MGTVWEKFVGLVKFAVELVLNAPICEIRLPFASTNLITTWLSTRTFKLNVNAVVSPTQIVL